MATVTHTEHLNAPPQRVWQIITNLRDYGWRSDLEEIEVLDETRFVEKSGGYATSFTITCFEPPHCYAFAMENDNMTGRWVGTLTPEGEGTLAAFTEEAAARKWFMRPFVGAYLKKQQARYFADLRRALG